MIPKLSSDFYSFNIVETSDGWKVTTITTKDGKTKVFRQICGGLCGLTNHFNSLTDQQLKDMVK